MACILLAAYRSVRGIVDAGSPLVAGPGDKTIANLRRFGVVSGPPWAMGPKLRYWLETEPLQKIVLWGPIRARKAIRHKFTDDELMAAFTGSCRDDPMNCLRCSLRIAIEKIVPHQGDRDDGQLRSRYGRDCRARS